MKTSTYEAVKYTGHFDQEGSDVTMDLSFKKKLNEAFYSGQVYVMKPGEDQVTISFAFDAAKYKAAVVVGKGTTYNFRDERHRYDVRKQITEMILQTAAIKTPQSPIKKATPFVLVDIDSTDKEWKITIDTKEIKGTVPTVNSSLDPVQIGQMAAIMRTLKMAEKKRFVSVFTCTDAQVQEWVNGTVETHRSPYVRKFLSFVKQHSTVTSVDCCSSEKEVRRLG